MKYLLDTNICVALFRGLWRISEKIDAVGLDNCYISEVTIAELWYGVECSELKEENARVLVDFINSIGVIRFEEAVREFARQRAVLKKKGKPIDNFDLLIGCTAKACGLTLVTDNVRHFERIDGLVIEDWADRGQNT